MSGSALLDVTSTILDVAIVYYLIYRVLLIIKGTRAVPMLIGLVAIVLLYFFSQEDYVNLPTFNWLLQQFINSLFLIVVVLFQSDIRRALAAFGRTQFLTAFRTGQGAQVIEELVKASDSLARQAIGALVVVEREADLSPYMEDATTLDAKVTKELLYALFVPERQNPLHDGAVVIRQGRVEAAGVFLPMSINPNIARNLGTRHRAALGLSEETDAVVLVVSEERGAVSLAEGGKLEQDLDVDQLRDRLTDLLIKRSPRLRDRRRARGLHRGDRDEQRPVER
ncbi:MAG: TIGR00159 family protein [Myxococcales bacterium]|nr:TIGR00159 family protein [Myxococcales bacterium]